MEQKMFWFLAWVQWSINSACVIQSMTWFISIYQLCVPIFKQHKICTVCLNWIKHEHTSESSFFLLCWPHDLLCGFLFPILLCWSIAAEDQTRLIRKENHQLQLLRMIVRPN